MSAEILFGISNKKPKRHRVTKTGLVDRRAALLEIVRAAQPATVRQIFYLASVRGIVAKDEGGYSRVQIDLVDMRRSGQLPYGWIVDHTRWQRRPVTFDGIDEALADTAATYRKALWRDAKSYVEIWLEKDALSGVITPITSKFDVPLMVARGYASETFIHAAGEYMAAIGKPCFVYHFGDFDPSGQDAARAVEKGLRHHAGNAEIHFERIAVTQRQIDAWRLPSRPTKQSDSRAKKFGPVSVELDAIDPNKLRELVEEVIVRHLPAHQYEILIAAARERGSRYACGGAMTVHPAESMRCLRRQRLVEHLHRLGPAPLGHFLREIENGASIPDHLERYSRIDPEFVRALGGDRYPPVLHALRGGAAMRQLQSWAAALGGEIVGDSFLCPGPGRPPDDRSLLVTPPGFTADGTEAEVANARDRKTAKRLGIIKVRP